MNLSFILLFLHLWGSIEGSLSQNACSKLPDVPHANVEYREGDVIRFTCAPGYTSAQASKYVCTSDGWLAVSRGKCYSCSTLPEVPHAHVSEETKKSEYQEGDVIHFTCESGYTSGPVIKYVCSSEGWLAVRQGACYFSGSSCDRPPAGKGVRVHGLPENENPILPDHVLTFSCDSPGNFLIGHAVLTCGKDGQWDSPFPSCTATSGCGRPPPLADGDTIGILRSQYRLNERVEYICQAYYTMQGRPFKTCQNGEWTGEIRCLKPCTVDREMMNSHNIAFRYSHDDKIFVTHGDSIEFMCTRGRRPVGTVGMRQPCNEGVIELPSCQ